MRRPAWYQLAALTALSAGLYVVLLYVDLAASALLAALVAAAGLTVAGQVRLALPGPVLTGARHDRQHRRTPTRSPSVGSTRLTTCSRTPRRTRP